jgi:ubiquinone/menaquinone biosynthesis C-methylase UbiE
MFKKSAIYYDTIYHFKDYAAATHLLKQEIERRHPTAQTLLDVACGTAKHLELLRSFFRVEGFDINPELLEIACRRCPGVKFHQGDMCSLQLERKYDVITCLFSSIGYVKFIEKLKLAVSTMALHLNPGGLLFIEPWFTPETYWTGTITANHVDQPDLKITWMYTSRREELLTVLDIHYLVGTSKGVDYFTERHELGLFTHEEYLHAFQEAGLCVDYEPKGLFGRGMYVGQRKSTTNCVR